MSHGRGHCSGQCRTLQLLPTRLSNIDLLQSACTLPMSTRTLRPSHMAACGRGGSQPLVCHTLHMLWLSIDKSNFCKHIAGRQTLKIRVGTVREAKQEGPSHRSEPKTRAARPTIPSRAETSRPKHVGCGRWLSLDGCPWSAAVNYIHVPYKASDKLAPLSSSLSVNKSKFFPVHSSVHQFSWCSFHCGQIRRVV